MIEASQPLAVVSRPMNSVLTVSEHTSLKYANLDTSLIFISKSMCLNMLCFMGRYVVVSVVRWLA